MPAARSRSGRFGFAKGSFPRRRDGRELSGRPDQHQVQGRLDARFDGLAPVAARFGIPIAAVNVGGLLSGLLGGKKAVPGTAKATSNCPSSRAGAALFRPGEDQGRPAAALLSACTAGQCRRQP